ncbi:MAG: Phage integrase family protein [Verrucomicrobia bacterium]|nr:Phage integrase family protein [Verrucomicrobiota bacterium]
MKTRFRLIRRESRGGMYYLVDTATGVRSSLQTSDPNGAKQIVDAKNQAEVQPFLNLQIAKAYLSAVDSTMKSRTWRQAAEALTATKQGANQKRWRTVLKDKALALLFDKVIIETQGDLLLQVLRVGCVSTNIYLRRLHNFCLDMNWLPWPLIPKRQWPAIRFKEKRAITWAEHVRIIERERNPERKAFYQLAWHLGASQSDLAHLQAEDVDWTARIVCFFRQKIRWRAVQPPQIRFGKEVEAILKTLPKTGPLFPYLINIDCTHRGTEFRQRCHGLGIYGVTLHSYRYAWAERAKIAGYPERFAQLALGHNSKAVHRAYSRNAQVTLPPLEEYENKPPLAPVIPLPTPDHPPVPVADDSASSGPPEAVANG